MGFFSWKTSDTNKSINNIHSGLKPFTVHMITHDGRIWTEDAYNGYGVFGGKDIYELIAELNHKEGGRSAGINLVYEGFNGKLKNYGGDFNVAANSGIRLPKLIENLESNFFDIPYPLPCKRQGYFYDSDPDDNFDDISVTHS